MGRGIIKIKDVYLEWSTVVDAPLTWGLTLDELRDYIKNEYGQQGLEELPSRLERVELNGTSFLETKLNDLINCNRAGDNETELTKEEIYKKYYIDRPT